MNARLSDLERRLSNMIRIGNVAEVDYKKARVRVSIGENRTAWLPWMTSRASQDECTWNPPGIGEQVVVISPSGELGAGVIIGGGIYKKDRLANGDKANISRTTFSDGASNEYDVEKHEQTITIPAGGKLFIKMLGEKKNESLIFAESSRIVFQVGGGEKWGYSQLVVGQDGIHMRSQFGEIKIDKGGVINISGIVKQKDGDIISNGISLTQHKHTSGTSLTSPPVP